MASPINISPSVVTAILVLSVTVILSTCLCLLIRYLIRRCGNSAADDFPVANGVGVAVSGNSTRSSFPSARRVSPEFVEDRALIDSLPLFTFASITTGRNRDCAVCLSKFEPQDELRLLPICCHAFHAQCVDTWLHSNQTKTCPLCRSIIFASEDEILSKVLAASASDGYNNHNGSFRIEIGNVSRTRRLSSDLGASRHSSTFSIGSFEYVIDGESEVATAATHTRAASLEKNDPAALEGNSGATTSNNLAAEVGTSRSWLREYVDRLSSRTLSFRSSGRFFGGSDRRNDVTFGDYDAEANRAGEEISEMFRWFSGV